MDRHCGEIARSWHHSVLPGHASAWLRPVRNKKRRSFLRRSHASPNLANPQPNSFRALVSAVMNRSISACVL